MWERSVTHAVIEPFLTILITSSSILFDDFVKCYDYVTMRTDTDWGGGDLPSVTLFTTNPTGTSMGLKPGMYSDRPATNHLSHGTGPLSSENFKKSK